jgi:hypothetical protein
MMKKVIKYALLLLFLIFGIYLGILLNTAPQAPQQVGLETFSVAKEIAHIKAIAQKPHPAGSREHDRVRDYIFRTLEGLGLNPEIQKTMSVRKMRWGGHRAVEVENIVAKLKGTNNSKAILLMAHYDSVSEGPGANDDGSGVAAILEILRALKAGGPLKNDVIALFSDAEELGLMGANAFYNEHRWVRDIGVVLNMDARGWKGITYMFESGDNAAWLVKALKKAAPYPIASSITSAIYKRMPNDTDFSIFKKAGFPGMNFSYIDYWYVYHKPIDDVNHLDKATLYHNGSTLLATTRQLGIMNLEQFAKGDAVYFNLLRSFMIIYSEKWVWIFTVIVGLLLIGTMAMGFRHKRLTVKGTILGFIGLAINIALAIGLVMLLWKLAALRYGAQLGALSRFPDIGNPFLLGFAFLVFALFSLLLAVYSKWANIPSLSAGALLWWLIGMVAITIYLPEGSFLLTWPLLCGILGLWTILYVKDAESISLLRVFLLGLFSLVGIIIVIQFFYSIIIGLSINVWLFGLLALLLGLLIPYYMVLRRRNLWLFSALLAFFGVAVFIFSLFGFNNTNRPIQNTVSYHLNTDSHEAYMNATYLDKWTLQFMKEAQPVRWGYKSEAPIADIQPPEIELLEENIANGSRTLKLKARSFNNAFSLSIEAAAETPIIGAEIEGKDIELNEPKKEKQAHTFEIEIFSPPVEGVELLLTFAEESAVEFLVRERRYGLPDEIHIPNPPENIMPRLLTYVTKAYTY